MLYSSRVWTTWNYRKRICSWGSGESPQFVSFFYLCAFTYINARTVTPLKAPDASGKGLASFCRREDSPKIFQ
jgi:hypothetical protein